jgi:hypothetical protein
VIRETHKNNYEATVIGSPGRRSGAPARARRAAGCSG